MLRQRFILAACAVCLALLPALPAGAAKGFKIGTPGPDDGPQLVTGGPDPVIRIPVGHQHAATGCIGYLYFSRTTMRFEVLHPDRDKIHSFVEQLSDLTVAKQWSFLGSGMPEAEFKFKDGRVYHFFRVKKKLIDAPNEKLGWDDILPWDMLIDAATRLDTVLAQIQASNALAAAAAKPPAAPVPAPAPTDDSAAMDSAGLDAPPPSPWTLMQAVTGRSSGNARP